jgi:phosphoglycolate phosphatase-like HAD superfamily hydrolase
MRAVIFDLDMTLIDSKKAENFRNKGRWNEVYKLIPELRPYPGINDLLLFLNKIKVKISIVTSSPQTYCSKIIKFNNWCIDSSVCYHDTKYHKPYADPILFAINKLGIAAVDTISLGDKDADIIASKKAGVKSGACLWGAEDTKCLLSSNPDYVFTNIEEIKSLF